MIDMYIYNMKYVATIPSPTASTSDGAAANLSLLLGLSASLCPTPGQLELVTVRSKGYDS